MIATMTVLIAVTLVLTVAGTLAGRGRTMTAAWVAPLYGGLVLVGIALGFYVAHSSAQRDYDRCVTLAERSAGSHASTLRLYDTFDVLLKTPHYTHDPIIPGQPSLRDGLNIDLPVLDPGNCVKP